jgi:hypothetical protein
MNPGLVILVCLLVVIPIIVYLAWAFFIPFAQETLGLVEVGQQRAAAGQARVVD